jgi:hypothetical protein
MDNSRDALEPVRPRRHRITRFLIRNSLGLVYLIWVAGTSVLVVHSYVTWDQPDANLAGAVPLLQTMPWSMLAALALVVPPSLSLIVLGAVVTAGALANAVILSWLGRAGAGLIRHTITRFRGQPAPTP